MFSKKISTQKSQKTPRFVSLRGAKFQAPYQPELKGRASHFNTKASRPKAGNVRQLCVLRVFVVNRNCPSLTVGLLTRSPFPTSNYLPTQITIPIRLFRSYETKYKSATGDRYSLYAPKGAGEQIKTKHSINISSLRDEAPCRSSPRNRLIGG